MGAPLRVAVAIRTRLVVIVDDRAPLLEAVFQNPSLRQWILTILGCGADIKRLLVPGHQFKTLLVRVHEVEAGALAA